LRRSELLVGEPWSPKRVGAPCRSRSERHSCKSQKPGGRLLLERIALATKRKLSARRERHPGRQMIRAAAKCAEKVSRIRRRAGIGVRRLDWRRCCKAEHRQERAN